jgi:hypothetical protein
MTHNHAEAFKLMTYATKDGSFREVIWNSRDGVTPFVVLSLDGREMEHIDWGQDKYRPDWQPSIGSRVFVDATLERCVQWSREWIERFNGDKKFQRMLEEVYPDLSHEQIAQKRGAEMLTEHGAPPPDIIVVTEGFREWLKTHRGRKAGGSDV